MNYLLCVSLMVVGGGKRCCPQYSPCGNYAPAGMSMVYSQNDCYHPVANCNPIEVARPVSNPTEEAAAPVSNQKVDAALAASDRLESLSQELGAPLNALPVSAPNEDFGGMPNSIRGFGTGDGGGLGNGGGFGFGNVNGLPRGTGTGSGSGSGDGAGDGNGNGQSDTNTDSRLTVNVFTNVDNVNNNTNTNTNTNTQHQEQNQRQKQWQYQIQNQNQNNRGNHCNGCGGGEQVPLPATVWMGFAGVAAAFVAKRFGMIG